jgi:shikimate kinase
VKRILSTGMLGTGKSTVIGELAAHGYLAVDMDEPGWYAHAPDGDRIWCEGRIQDFLAREDGEVCFVAIVLLSVPAALLVERLATRTNNPYGKHPDELAEVLGYRETVEPRLRRGATHEIDTSAPLDQVVATLLRLVAP